MRACVRRGPRTNCEGQHPNDEGSVTSIGLGEPAAGRMQVNRTATHGFACLMGRVSCTVRPTQKLIEFIFRSTSRAGAAPAALRAPAAAVACGAPRARLPRGPAPRETRTVLALASQAERGGKSVALHVGHMIEHPAPPPISCRTSWIAASRSGSTRLPFSRMTHELGCSVVPR